MFKMPKSKEERKKPLRFGHCKPHGLIGMLTFFPVFHKPLLKIQDLVGQLHDGLTVLRNHLFLQRPEV